jgi:hypothetical protein
MKCKKCDKNIDRAAGYCYIYLPRTEEKYYDFCIECFEKHIVQIPKGKLEERLLAVIL